ncbi:hypothetical protein AAFF_G00176240 [Aldrovandia affinis]|uniref:Peptidase A2 domain-containing protein n=1 Tax=Aldrovandia affinis TaxID=143900 RepID=A0AAD7RLC1_9TELE|nr:hypothetical protein AAFF_G00176240 [Aldrovandia affinis]
MDTLTGRRFLCDTGAQVSVLPVSLVDGQLGKVGPTFEAANGSRICTFGKRTVPLCLSGRRFTWEFVLADVDRPLLGADFLCTNGLLVDVRNRQLIDAKDFNSLPCTRSSFPSFPGPRCPVHSQAHASSAVCWLSFPTWLSPRFPQLRLNMVSFTTFRRLDLQCTPVLDD